MKVLRVLSAVLLFWGHSVALVIAAETSQSSGHGTQKTGYKLVFRGFSKEETRGIDVYLVEFPGYLEHSILRDDPGVREVRFLSRASEDRLSDDLVRMLAYLDVDGGVRLEDKVFHIETKAAQALLSSDEGDLLEEVEPFSMKLSSTRGPDPVYRIGETLELLVELDQDAWVYCFFGQADGSLFLLFPNLYHKLAWLDGGRKHEIAGDGYPFYFKIVEPPGEETLTCFATDRNVDSELPGELRRLDNARLPEDVSRRLSEIFRGIPAVGLTEATLTITVTR